MDISLLTAAFIMGFAGNLHCMAMCGGIASSLGATGTANGHQNSKNGQKTIASSEINSKSSTNNPSSVSKALRILTFNAGRIMSYMLAGFLIASFGWISKSYLIGYSGIDYARLASAVFILLVAFYILDIKKGLIWLEKTGNYLWKIIQPISKLFLPVKSNFQALGLGLVWGWLPCGMVYSALVLAVTSANSAVGALVMLAFGVGTLPSMVAIGIAAQKINHWRSLKSVRTLMFIVLVASSFWTGYQAIP